MDKQPYIDRMLEIENLTDELEDDDANWLLAWGSKQMETVLAGIEDSEIAGNQANALMAVMRKINRIAGSYQDKSPAALSADLSALYDLFGQAFGPAGGQARNQATTATEHTGAISGQAPAALQAASQKLSQLDTHQALEFMTSWYFEKRAAS